MFEDIEKLFEYRQTPLQTLTDQITGHYGVTLSLKREDLNQAGVAGNKYWKLKYNLIEACRRQASALLSFGGAYSNHVLALAAAGRILHVPTIAIIRGEELQSRPLNPVLQQAQRDGMALRFVSRSQYRSRSDPEYLQQLMRQYAGAYLIPEGGSNRLAVKGVAEMIAQIDQPFDVVVCACGTGGTLAGIIQGLYECGRHDVNVIGIAVLKGGDFIGDRVRSLLASQPADTICWRVETGFHSGGYARYDDELLGFMHWFRRRHAIELDTIYTGKMMHAIYSMIKTGRLARGARVLAIHSGGMQTAALSARNPC